MKAKLFVGLLVKSAMALGSIAILSQYISVNPQLTTLALEQPPNLLSVQTLTTAVSSQASTGNSINQPMRTAGISLGGTFAIFLVLGVVVFVVISSRGVVVIGNNEFGIVIKKFNLNPFSPKLPAGQLIAFKGEAGPQAKILTPGLHWGYFPQMYTVRKEKVIQVQPDEIGLVVAKDGAPMVLGQLFGKVVECNNFQDARAFIKNKGQKGQQLEILTPGTYRINTELFTIHKKPAINIPPGKIGLVVAKDGAPMLTGQLLGKVVDCNNFQDARAFIENGGQKGKQLGILTTGIYQVNTDLFTIHSDSVINIPPGEIGLVVAEDGAPMPAQQVLGKVVDCNNFQDARAFIENGGQKGRQLAILTTGTYQINTDLFTVITAANATQYGMKPEDLQVYTVETGKIGIVTTYDGISIEPGEIAGSPVAGHDNFQNGQKFIDGGGRKGLQEEVLPDGSWNLNPWFIKVEQVELTDVPVGTVGVVISHVGKSSENKAGVVERGYKGVWNTPLYPGKYVINTKVIDVEMVPAQPITLDWSNKTKPPTNYDASLNAIKLCSKDGFRFDVEVTQVIRVPEKNAPTMIYRVGKRDDNSANGSIKALILRVLQPAVENHFRNSAKDSRALDFHERRSDQQRQANDYIKSALNVYGVEAGDTLIGEVDLPDQLEKILTDREIAQQQRITIQEQQRTEEKRRELAHAKAITNIQPDIVQAENGVKIAQLNAEAKRYDMEVDIERAQRLSEIELQILRITIDIIGHEGWQDIEKLKQLVKLKLPEVWVSNSHDGGSGLIDAVMPQVLRTLRTSTIGSNNGLSPTNQENQTLKTSSPSTALPQGYVSCTYCETKNLLGNNFCSKCGKALTS
ncbi:MAG: hypothetical protein KME57_31825 [Scytonema hyalinum WJT4-NPBG1]|jgi:uncharacterized membrane protein YqiK|nr:hypothetical protein [Scytonema hyalinum WJT4-NPBG1]